MSPLRPAFPPLRPRLRQTIAWGLAMAWLMCTAAFVEAANSVPSERYFARNWRVDDGLPHNSVNRIVQDARGFLWVATSGGVARFDGVEFREFLPPRPTRDASISVRDLAIEDECTLLVLPASGGVLRLRDGVFSEHPANALLAGRQLLSLFVERPGVLWLGGVQEVLRWENGRLSVFGPAEGISRRGPRTSFGRDARGRVWIAMGEFLGVYEEGNLRRFPQNLGLFVTLAEGRNGDLWVATSDRLQKLRDGVLQPVLAGPAWMEDRAGLQEMFEDRSGVLWITSRRFGLARFADGKITRVATSHDQTIAVMEDTEGNLWVATNGGGIDRLRPQTFRMLDASNGLEDDISTGVCEDTAGALWCANRRGGLARFAAGKLTFFHPAGAVTGPYLNVVCPDPRGGVWAGSTDGLFRVRAEGSRLELVTRNLRDIHVLHVARNGDLWVGSGDDRFGYFRDGIYHPLSSENGYNGRRVRAVAEDSRGGIFMAADDIQLFEMVGERLQLRLARDAAPGGAILALHFDAQDRLWMATSQGLGLMRGDKIHTLTTQHGLPDDLISQLLEDDRGRLWLGSRRGIFSVEKSGLLAVADGKQKQVNASTLGREEGLFGASALSGLQPMAWKGQDGRLWFATHEGLVGVDSAAAPLSPVPPRVYVDEVLIDGRVAPHAGVAQLDPGERQVEFRFAALHYSAPEKVRVRHQLAGHDFDWVELGGERRATYSRLAPGTYRLRIAASNHNGRWHENEAPFTLIVLPAWWQTWWALAAFGFGFTALVVVAVRFWSHRRLRLRLERLEHEHALEKERARIARDLHDDLGGSLTQIGLLADRLKRQEDVTAIKPALGQLVWRTRRLAGDLESIVWTVSPKNNTWDRLASFIGQYVRGFCRDTTLQCEVTGEDAIPALPLEPDAQHHVLAVLKEALNNVLKHAQATRVVVTMTAVDGDFRLRIADDGIGFDPAAPEHAERNGLSNMRGRAADVGGAIEILSPPGGGVEILLSVRLAGTPAPRMS